ncbi:Gp49 family protein [Yersinia aleksiciae]|uniref:Gp49 family protein n=1 Tax=Yersinia aleksiciae TaxID=263819 RepID=UPI0011A60FFF|nr:Gp49 family protein [Yersinia aleksiciae]
MPKVTDQSIEQEIQEKGLTAPRITPDHIESVISSEHYFTAGDGYAGVAALTAKEGDIITPPSQLDLLTFCVLVLKNGFTVSGESACASPENFNEEIGRKIARQNAVNKIWMLEGYLLKDRIHADAHLKELLRIKSE